MNDAYGKPTRSALRHEPHRPVVLRIDRFDAPARAHRRKLSCLFDADLDRLLQIRAYRNAGLSIEDIRAILATKLRTSDARRVLERRLVELDAEKSAPCARISTPSSNCWARRPWERDK